MGETAQHDFQHEIDAVHSIAAVPTILDVICRSTGMGFAAVARVTEDRWVACQVLDNVDFGLPAGGELKVETTLCHEVRQHRATIVIDNVAEDATYCRHHTPEIYGLQSYISVPIVMPDGRFFGTLCAIDPKPAKLNNPVVLRTFELFAELIAYHLDAHERISAAERRAAETVSLSRTREEFIAVLGHDLRNPLAAINGGLDMLLRAGEWTAKTPAILELMKGSVSRALHLIENVTDLARTRLGSGIGLNLDPSIPLQPTLEQVVNEIRSAHPDRDITTDFHLHGGLEVDHTRIAQLLSNLLGNAVMHGAADGTVRVEGKQTGAGLEITVANTGDPIPAGVLEEMFQPFRRGKLTTDAQGLGLGLYIASQIAEAHGGRIEVISTASETKFSFLMPLHPAHARFVLR